MTHTEDIWTCTECGDEQGRHDMYFDGICEKCHSKDSHITDVVFRKFKEGDIVALLPHEVCTHKGDITSYMHVGQHSSADYGYVVSITKLANEDEYKALKSEMEDLGYNFNVIKKQNRKKYLASYYEVRK